MIAFAAHTPYQKMLNSVLSFVVMGASEDFLHLTTMQKSFAKGRWAVLGMVTEGGD